MCKKNNITFLLIKTIACVIVGAALNLIVHEISHLISLLMFGGAAEEFSLGQLSFVAGYLDRRYIAPVALSSLIVPMCLSAILLLIKNYYMSSINLGFTLPTIINGVLGLFATIFVKNQSRETYDVALAFNNTSAKFLVILFVITNIILCSLFMGLCFKQMSRSLDT